MKVLRLVNSLEDRVFQANLQQSLMNGNELFEQMKAQESSSEAPLDLAKSRILELETRIDRRYLKYPFAPNKKLSHVKLNRSDLIIEEKVNENEHTLGSLMKKRRREASDAAESDKYIVAIHHKLLTLPPVPSTTPELERWKRLVRRANTAAQLALLVAQLNKLIAWEKSIMKVICQICNCDDNEDKLLLCDNCDSGNHTYCFKPKIEL